MIQSIYHFHSKEGINMNKIYKVIWSKAKHTYVVASEIAKGHTKGETTGKGLKKLAAAMLVAAALLSPNFAWAADIVTVTDTSTTQQTMYTKDGADNIFATKGSLDKEAADREAADTKEAGVREAADTKEAAAREAADTTLQSNIDKEATAREIADTKLQTAVDAKANAADVYSKDVADDTFATKKSLAQETADRETADTKLQQAVDAKANAADVYSKDVADDTFATKKSLAQETADRETADTKLQQAVDAKANAADVYSKDVADDTFATKKSLAQETADRESADSALDSRTSALEAKTGSLNRVAAANSTSINEFMTLKGNQYSATLQVNGSGAQIGVVNNSVAGLANDGGTAYTEYRTRTGAILSKATNDISSTSSNGQVVDTAGDTTGEYSQAATKSTGTTFTYSNDGGKTSSSTTIKGNSVSTGTVSATAGITDETTKDGKSVIASQTVGQNLNALDERITNVKEYLEKQTSDTYVSKDDAAVQDGAIVKAANTIGDNVTKLDAALAKETAARLGADKAQDKVIQQVNENAAAGIKTLKEAYDNEVAVRQSVDTTLQTNIDNEAEARKAADGKLVDAVNSGLSLSDDNVLQKNTTAIDDQGNVTTSKTAANEMILNKDGDNQITLNEKGIKVGTNSSVMDKDGVYTGGDTYSEAKAALKSDGSIKGADGKFTVDGTTGNVSTKGSLTAASGTIGNVSMSADGTVTGVKDLTASGKVTADSFTDGTATMSNGSLNGVNQINATGNIVTTSNMQAHDMTATGTITGQNINGTTGTFGSLSTIGNASVGGTLTTNGITNTGNATTDTLTVNHNATVGGNLGVTGDITGKSLNVGTGDIKGGQITGTGLDVGAGTIKTTGAVETGTLTTTGNATIGGNLGVKGNLSVEGEFNSKTLTSKLDENNYTTITGGKTESMNLKMDKKTGEIQASGSTFDETGSNAWAKDDESIGKSSMTADKISQSLSDTGDNPKNAASRVLSQNTNNKYEITDSVVEGNQSNVENRTADTTDSQISFKDDSGKVLNKSYITQNLKKVLMGVEEGDNKTTIEQDANNITNTAKNGTITNDAGKLVNTASDTIANMAGNDITNTSTNGNIANTAANGTISNNAKNLTNTASENITNKAENGNISNIASNGTISNEAKTISNKATEALTNDAKTITNTARESVTTQIGDGSEVQSVMNGGGIANKATGKSITNDAAKITNTGTTSVTNQVGNNKVLVDTTHVQSAFGNTIYTTWDESGITNNATDKTVATNAKNIQNTATGDITNTAEKGTITNKAQNLVNDASGNMTTTVGGEMKTTVTGKVTEDYKSDLDTKVGGNQTTTVTGDSSLSAKNITNTATVKLSNSAAEIENSASKSILNQVGENTSWKMTDGTVLESIKGADGQTNTITDTADSTVQNVKNGSNELTSTTSSTNADLTINNGSSAYTKVNTATGNKETVKEGENLASTNLTKDGFNVYAKDENGHNTIINNASGTTQTIQTDDEHLNVTTKTVGSSEEKLTSGSSVIDVLKNFDDNGNPAATSSVTDGTNTSEVKQTASEVAASAKDISNTASTSITDKVGENVERTMTTEKIQDKVGKTTVTTTDGKTKLTNEGGTHKTEMDFAEVLKDLGVRGNAAVDGNTTLGKKGADTTLTVNSTSTFNKDVTMKENLDVEGTTTTAKLVVDSGATIKGGATVTGGTTTDTLHVTSTSTFDGKATFKDIVTMEKDLSVGGNATVAGDVTANSYKVGDKTYIDKDGINANNQVIRNVGQGNISEGSTDAVSGGQLYETNTRVSGLETRMGTVETKVDKLDGKIDKVGANAAAMANLHPLEFDEDSKWNVAAAVGSSGSETASAVGVFYRPNENVMVNASAAMGTGENMFGGGVSLRLGHGGNKAKEAQMKAAAAENKELRAKVDDLTARMDALLSVLNPNMSKDFPDVPENHWAYEAVSRLAGNGIVEGYEDGKYHGERQMTRYEMAEIIYNALSKGAKAEKKLVEEFRPELQAMAAQKKA